MKKVYLNLLIMVVGILAVQSMAIAAPFIDHLAINPNIYMSAGSSFTHTFNLDTDLFIVGDINAEDTINSARLFVNTNDDWDWSREYMQVTADGSLVINREVDWRTYSANITSQVFADHTANVTVRCTRGDFYLDWMQVRGDYTDNPEGNPVPEPMTMLLFGPALLGLVGLKKKRA